MSMTGMTLDLMNGRPPKFRGGLRPLAHRRGQGRHLRRRVHVPRARPGGAVARTRLRRLRQGQCDAAGADRRRARLSRSRRPWSAAPTARRRSSAACATTIAIRAPMRAASSPGLGAVWALTAGLGDASGGARFLRAVRRRRARLWRRRSGFRRGAHRVGRAPQASDVAALRARRGDRRLRRRRARLVFRRRANQRRDLEILGLCRCQLSPDRARRSAITRSIRCSTNTARSISAKSPAACGCSTPNCCPASSTGRSPRRCSASISCCLSALMERSLRPIKGLVSAEGPRRPRRAGGSRDALGPLDGADHQFLPAPVARSDLVQSGRRRAHAGVDRRRHRPAAAPIFAPSASTIFIGLLAYDWLRVLIWFDHMGLRVATLVNLSFVGGDALDEAAGALCRPCRAHARHSRRHPALCDLGAAADPLLHSARRRVGQGLDRRRELCTTPAARWPGPVRVLAAAYALAGVAMALGALIIAARAREKLGRRRPGARRCARGAERIAARLCPSTMARSASICCATGAARPSCWARRATVSRSI